MKCISPTLIIAFWASTACSGEIIFGMGLDDVLNQTDTPALVVAAEYHAPPFLEMGHARYSFALAGQVDRDGDLFLGGGVHTRWSPRGGPWFIEGTIMPGLHKQSANGTPLNGSLQFRSLIGVGYSLENGKLISFALDHKSNGRLEDPNPGSETLMVRYQFAF